MPLTRILLLGANGAVGRAFSRLLAGEGRIVVGADLGETRADESVSEYLRADVSAPSPELLRQAAGADCVLAALPEPAILATLGAVVPAMRPGSLFVDTSSVKSEIVERAERDARAVEFLSINPLFAPSVPFRGQNVAVVGERGGERAREFVALMEGWGGRVVPFTAEEHDRSMACIQTATHAAVLAFGLALRELDYQPRWISDATTPPHRLLLGLLARITGANPEVYWEIQRANPFAPAAREALAEGLRKLEGVVADEHAFREMFARSAEPLGSEAPVLRDLCARLFAVPFKPG
ncbi:prephenate dehydrogenase/arogenate dehydrogenase family protein [Archangium gephyra]|nr:prephenate dehydrogenase/arogenate dehydrogenase family protein [Archangium gephyra]